MSIVDPNALYVLATSLQSTETAMAVLRSSVDSEQMRLMLGYDSTIDQNQLDALIKLTTSFNDLIVEYYADLTAQK